MRHERHDSQIIGTVPSMIHENGDPKNVDV